MTRRRRLTFSLLLIACVHAPHRLAGQAARDTTITMETLREGIYLFRAPSSLDYWTASNAVVVINDRDVTVFDSHTRPITARKVIAEIRKLTDKPVRTLINSHWHMDHWSGNDEYAKAFPGIQIIATTQTRDYMKVMRSEYFAQELIPHLASSRAALDTAIRTGKLSDGSPLTPEARRTREASIEGNATWLAEIMAIPRVLPNVVYRDTMVFWSGNREFRLISATGDATASTVLYLPGEKLLVTGDVLVTPENGKGTPPWTMNSYALSEWLGSLRGLQTLDATIIVPGQGPALHDRQYLNLTVDLFASVIGQVRSALGRGIVTYKAVNAEVNVDSIGRLYTPGAPLGPYFHEMVADLVKRAHQEALDGRTP